MTIAPGKDRDTPSHLMADVTIIIISQTLPGQYRMAYNTEGLIMRGGKVQGLVQVLLLHQMWFIIPLLLRELGSTSRVGTIWTQMSSGTLCRDTV